MVNINELNNKIYALLDQCLYNTLPRVLINMIKSYHCYNYTLFRKDKEKIVTYIRQGINSWVTILRLEEIVTMAMLKLDDSHPHSWTMERVGYEYLYIEGYRYANHRANSMYNFIFNIFTRKFYPFVNRDGQILGVIDDISYSVSCDLTCRDLVTNEIIGVRKNYHPALCNYVLPLVSRNWITYFADCDTDSLYFAPILPKPSNDFVNFLTLPKHVDELEDFYPLVIIKDVAILCSKKIISECDNTNVNVNSDADVNVDSIQFALYNVALVNKSGDLSFRKWKLPIYFNRSDLIYVDEDDCLYLFEYRELYCCQNPIDFNTWTLTEDPKWLLLTSQF